jgi:hypothetical protein
MALWESQSIEAPSARGKAQDASWPPWPPRGGGQPRKSHPSPVSRCLPPATGVPKPEPAHTSPRPRNALLAAFLTQDDATKLEGSVIGTRGKGERQAGTVSQLLARLA